MNLGALRWLSVAFVVLSVSPAQRAHAFCRATTIESQVDTCFATCETDGYPLAWSQPDVEYIFNERGFPSLNDTTVRGIFDQAFARWLAVTCNGKQVPIDVQQSPGTTALSVREKEVQPKVNVMGYLTATEWSEANYDPHAFAQTGVRYFPDSGVIAGADIWFNGGIGDFGVCPDRGCSVADDTVDLPNVATHEIGHFFGLGHTRVDGATMACDALPGDTDKRTLEADDRAGMCAIYPPDEAFRGPYVRGEWTKSIASSGKCSAAPGEAGPSLWGFGLVALAAWLARRRVQTVRGSS